MIYIFDSGWSRSTPLPGVPEAKAKGCDGIFRPRMALEFSDRSHLHCL